MQAATGRLRLQLHVLARAPRVSSLDALAGLESREGVAKTFENLGIGGCAIPTIYEFGPFRLDAQGETLFRGTEPVALSHRALALLRILIDRAGAPVSKDAPMEAAWPGLAVEDSNLTVQIAALRRALGMALLVGRSGRCCHRAFRKVVAFEPAAEGSSHLQHRACSFLRPPPREGGSYAPGLAA